MSRNVLARVGLVLVLATQSSPQSALENEPAELIRRCSEHEVTALQALPRHFHYLERLEWKWGTETREVIETEEGRADRIIRFNDQPLAPDQAAKQDRRLRKLLADARSVKHEVDEQQAETRRRIRMMQAFASAFVFHPDDEEAGLLKFKFRPNRAFAPEDRETAVYRGMEGTVWIEPEQQRLVRIEGVLTRDVSFGWGIFGRLHKGGHYFIEQTQVEPGVWRITSLDLDLKIRVFLDSSRILRREHNSEFEATQEDMSYKQALEELLRPTDRPDDGGK